MTPDAWMLVLGVVLVLLLVWTFWTLTRLRRLDARVGRAWTALDTQLRRRAALAAELARDHLAAGDDPRAAGLAARAADACETPGGDRGLSENALGQELRDVVGAMGGDAPGGALRDELVGTATRIGLARRFYNDAVRDTRALRGSRFVRATGLHRSRPLPRYFDIDPRLEVLGSRQDGSGPGRG